MNDGGPVNFVLDVPAEPACVRLAREMAGHLADSCGGTNRHETELIVSELVTNAVRHGSANPQDRILVRLSVADGSIHGEVEDSGGSFDGTRRPLTRDQTGGFGLHIIDQLASDWEIQRHDNGNRVVFNVSSRS